MSDSQRRPRLLLAVGAITVVCAAAYPAAAQDAFHVTFGTTGDTTGRNADGVSFLAETTSGDLVVAGNGASYSSDDGIGSTTNPLLARISPHGELRWQRVYTELVDQRIIALAAHGETLYVVLERVQRWRSNKPSAVTLRRIDEEGGLSDPLATLEGLRIFAARQVAHGESRHFLIAGTRGTGLEILRLEIEGNVTSSGPVHGVDGATLVEDLGQEDFLLLRQRTRHEHVVNGRPIIDSHTDLLRLRATGETELLFRTTDKQCNRAAVSTDRIVCLETPSLRTDETRDVMVIYATDGRELWRRELPTGISVERLYVLDSGHLVCSYHEGRNTVVRLFTASGEELWTSTLRSTGPYTFIGPVEQLRDGRVAFAGSTGPWNGLVSEDTSAMVVVTAGPTSPLEDDPSPIVSHIVAR